MKLWVLETYNSPYSNAVIDTMKRVSWHGDNALRGDWEEAYKLMKRRHEKEFPFDDKRLWSWHNGAWVWDDPEDIYKIDWFTCDDEGWCDLRDCGKVYLHFELLNNGAQLPLL